MTDAIATPVQTLVTLFNEELQDVRFPDVDAAVLDAAASEVRDLAASVARAEAALEAARAALEGGQEALLAKSQRALAYARIYAEDEPALAARLEAIVLPRALRRALKSEGGPDGNAAAEAIPAAPRRGRARKESPAPLFAPAEAEPIAAAG